MRNQAWNQGNSAKVSGSCVTDSFVRLSNRSGQVCCPFFAYDDCSERTSRPMEQTCDRSEQSSSSWNSAVLKFWSVFMTVQPPQWMEKQFQKQIANVTGHHSHKT